jgi:hypothetical protein
MLGTQVVLGKLDKLDRLVVLDRSNMSDTQVVLDKSDMLDRLVVLDTLGILEL